MFNLASWRNRERRRAAEYPLANLRNEFGTLFDRFFGILPAAGEGGDVEYAWGLDVDETDREVIVRAEAPGFEAKDFDVELSGNVLHIRAEQKKEEKKDEKEKGGFTERRFARFERLVTLPEHLDRNKIEASYRNGVLEVRLPKTPEAQGKRIEVKS